MPTFAGAAGFYRIVNSPGFPLYLCPSAKSVVQTLLLS